MGLKDCKWSTLNVVNWPPVIKVRHIENWNNKMGLKGYKQAQLFRIQIRVLIERVIGSSNANAMVFPSGVHRQLLSPARCTRWRGHPLLFISFNFLFNQKTDGPQRSWKPPTRWREHPHLSIFFTYVAFIAGFWRGDRLLFRALHIISLLLTNELSNRKWPTPRGVVIHQIVSPSI